LRERAYFEEVGIGSTLSGWSREMSSLQNFLQLWEFWFFKWS
jgi:hypothetical protein